MTSNPVDIDYLRSWMGNQERSIDTLTPELVKRYRATLGDHVPLPASQIPLGIHWCLAPVAAPHGELGVDGHPARGGFLPPVPLPRRMWASSKLTFYSSAKVNASIERTSVVADVLLKRSPQAGTLVFVQVDHEYRQNTGKNSEPLLNERQTIVYKEHAPFSPAAPALADDAPCALSFIADSRLLFRYSALTFNAHRIHYDHLYATSEEGYPGLVVHGPLMATLLMNLAQQTQATKALGCFEFRAAAPAFADQTLSACTTDEGRENFAIRNQHQALIMTAKASFADNHER